MNYLHCKDWQISRKQGWDPKSGFE